jgi:hypothetical protein
MPFPYAVAAREAGPSAHISVQGYREKNGQLAGPSWVQFEPGDLRIGADPLSVVELAADIRRVESELIEIEARTQARCVGATMTTRICVFGNVSGFSVAPVRAWRPLSHRRPTRR